MNRTEDRLQAEFALIGGLMCFADQALVIAEHNLTAEHFANPAMRAAFAAINALLEDGQEPEPVAVFGRIRDLGLDADLQSLTEAQHSVGSEASVRAAAKLLTQAKLRRDLEHTLGDAFEAVRAGEPGDIIDRLQTALTDLQTETGRREPKTAAELADDRLAYYDQLLRGEHINSAMATHIPGLDRALNGGLEGGRLYILAARPSVGKSSFAEWIVLRLARDGHRGLFLSLEMPCKEVTDRAVSSLGEVSYELIQTGKVDGRPAPDDAWTKITDGLEVFRGLPLSVDDQAGLTLAHIRAKAFAVKRRGLKVLVLDYLQLCEGVGDTRNAELEGLTKGLKKLAKELDIAVIVLSQLNREVDKRATGRPQLSDLRDSGAIEQDADVVMFLWRVQRDNQGEVGLAIEKNRQGRPGQILLEFRGETQRWGESVIRIEERLQKPPKDTKRGGLE